MKCAHCGKTDAPAGYGKKITAEIKAAQIINNRLETFCDLDCLSAFTAPRSVSHWGLQ